MKLLRSIVSVAAVALCVAPIAFGQAPKSPTRASPEKATRANNRTPANLAQLMKGIIYPASNVVFAAQNDNPNDVKPAKDPSTATDPLQSAYGKWEAVENAALAMSEAASLLTIPGRSCSNGRFAPISAADWGKWVRELREAGLTVYAAAKTKDTDKIVDAADKMTTACSNCHDKYREKPTPAQRCR
jgi:hypothetical protein